MAKKTRASGPKAKTSKKEQTTRYGIYDRRSGELVAVHNVTVMAGARALSDDFIQKRVLTCAAQAVERPRASLRVTTALGPIEIAPRSDAGVSGNTTPVVRAADPRVTP